MIKEKFFKFNPTICYIRCHDKYAYAIMFRTRISINSKFDPDEWLTYFRKYRPEHIIAIPAYIAAMLDNNKLRNQDLSF